MDYVLSLLCYYCVVCMCNVRMIVLLSCLRFLGFVFYAIIVTYHIILCHVSDFMLFHLTVVCYDGLIFLWYYVLPFLV